MEKIILVGGGGHCHSVIDIIEEEGKYRIHGIIEKDNQTSKEIMGYPVIGYDKDLPKLLNECSSAVITVGQIESSALREKLFFKLKKIGFKLPTIISPLAYVAKTVKLDEGTVVMHHALINTNVTIGKGCIINTKALIEHDTVVKDFCHVSTAAVLNGGVTLEKGCFFGSNATSKQGIQISSFIKAGSIAK